MRNLVVDDIEFRHVEFQRILKGQEIDRAFTVTEAVTFMRERMIMVEPIQHYNVIFLDHDIESGFDRRDVVHFVDWICGNQFLVDEIRKAGTKFFIHSQNFDGARNMASRLLAHGFPVLISPFRCNGD